MQRHVGRMRPFGLRTCGHHPIHSPGNVCTRYCGECKGTGTSAKEWHQSKTWSSSPVPSALLSKRLSLGQGGCRYDKCYHCWEFYALYHRLQGTNECRSPIEALFWLLYSVFLIRITVIVFVSLVPFVPCLRQKRKKAFSNPFRLYFWI